MHKDNNDYPVRSMPPGDLCCTSHTKFWEECVTVTLNRMHPITVPMMTPVHHQSAYTLRRKGSI